MKSYYKFFLVSWLYAMAGFIPMSTINVLFFGTQIKYLVYTFAITTTMFALAAIILTAYDKHKDNAKKM